MVYFIKDTVSQAIKIGYSANPEKRLSELQTGTPHKLLLLGTIRGNLDVEAQLHARFVQHRLEGEWFSGDVIEEVLDLIAADKERRRQIRRKTMTEPTGDGNNCADVTPPAAPAAVSVDDAGTLDTDSGIRGVCRIPGLQMKRFSLKLTEEQEKVRGGQGPDRTTYGMEIKYVLEFVTAVKRTAPADGYSLSELHTALATTRSDALGLQHTFLDEDNAVIPFSPPPSSCHVVGGAAAITGEQGSAFRVLVAFQKMLSGSQATVIKDVFTGDNFTGEHPLKNAKVMVVNCPLPEKPPPGQANPVAPSAPKTEERLSVRADTAHGDRRKEIHIPDGWSYWSHHVAKSGKAVKEEVLRDAHGRIITVAIEPAAGAATLSVTIRKADGR